jgi:hydroxymethylpyrimidine pyrophosphatase-like HAD family hydrolase
MEATLLKRLTIKSTTHKICRLSALFLIAFLTSTASSSSSQQPQRVYFVSDFDGTLAHYETYEGENTDSLVQLPASTGFGRVAHVSSRTLELLTHVQELSRRHGTATICASGQRVSTMQQRRPVFPAFDYWISENGGRIHDSDLVELTDWTEVICSTIISFVFRMHSFLISI